MILLVAVALLTLILSPTARAAEGLPDPTFGSGGFTILNQPESPQEDLTDVVVLPDGKILAGGTSGSSEGFLLARYNADGTPDLSFGPNGIRVLPDTNTAGSPRGINEIALLGDGRVVVAGLGRGPEPELFDAFAVGRFLPSGLIDPEFGHAGLRVLEPDGAGEAQDMDVAPDGKILVSGYRIEALMRYEPAVLRLTAGGSADPTFAAAAPVGFAHFKVPGSEEAQAHAVRVLPDGSVITGGESEVGAWLAKLDDEGNLVSSFGNAGITTEDLGQEADPSGEVNDIAVQPDGRIVVTGSSFPATDTKSQLIVARFTAGGDLDPSFGNGGVFTLDATGGYDEGEALSILPDGKVLVAGFRGTSDSWLLRLTAGGQLDPSFGTGGQTIAAVSPGADIAEGLAVQPNGRPVIAGAVEAPAGEGAELLAGRFTGPEPVTVSAIPTRERCDGRTASIVGTGGADKLTGTRKADVIAGLGGADRIKGLAGNDIVCGGPGKDTINGGPGKDTLLGEAGKDHLLGGPGKKDVCNGGPGRDVKQSLGCERRRKLP